MVCYLSNLLFLRSSFLGQIFIYALKVFFNENQKNVALKMPHFSINFIRINFSTLSKVVCLPLGTIFVLCHGLIILEISLAFLRCPTQINDKYENF